MKFFRRSVFILPILLVTVRAQPPPSSPRSDPTLDWDTMSIHHVAQVGDKTANLVYNVTNPSARAVEITEIKTSCGCTTTDNPPLPWTLAPGARGTLKATVDLAGKFGEMTKTIRVTSTVGLQVLEAHLTVPLPMAPAEQRKQLEQIMLTDRQAIFRREDCVSCHAHPAARKLGEPLFEAACAICHVAEHRASSVPDLAAPPREPRDAAFWRKLITEGREHTLMPAFGQPFGGPLNESQIESLVVYALSAFPTKAAGN